MNGWEISAVLIAAVSLLVNIIQGYALKRRKDQVEVSGSVHVQQKPKEGVTVDHMSVVLGGYATKTDLSDVEDQLGNKIEQKFSQLDGKRSEDIRGLHDKVNKTREDVARLAERTETQTAMLSNMDAKLTNLMRRPG
jgi:hypothetical protein